MATYQAHQEDA